MVGHPVSFRPQVPNQADVDKPREIDQRLMSKEIAVPVESTRCTHALTRYFPSNGSIMFNLIAITLSLYPSKWRCFPPDPHDPTSTCDDAQTRTASAREASCFLSIARMLLVAMPGAPSSFLFRTARTHTLLLEYLSRTRHSTLMKISMKHWGTKLGGIGSGSR